MRRVFDETIDSHLGPNATDQDFPAEDLTPDFDHYDDDHDLDPDHGDLEVTPEVGDNYLNAEISVPQGGTLLKGCVTARKRDKDEQLPTCLDPHILVPSVFPFCIDMCRKSLSLCCSASFTKQRYKSSNDSLSYFTNWGLQSNYQDNQTCI
jgi:hypothetical protein